MSPSSIIGIIVSIAAAAFCIYMSLRSMKKQKQERNARLTEHEASDDAKMENVVGLPIAPGAPVMLYDSASQYKIVRDNQEWILPKSRVIDMQWATGNQLKHMVGGNGVDGGAVAAGYLLGGFTGAALGALIGNAHYMVIVYHEANSDEPKTIILKHVESAKGWPGFIKSTEKMYSSYRSTQPTTTQEL